VICTDKTGTLTENRMRVVLVWTEEGEHAIEAWQPDSSHEVNPLQGMARVMVACNNAHLDDTSEEGDPTEIALLRAASWLTARLGTESTGTTRLHHFHFDPVLKLMTTIDERDGSVWVDTKGAPEAVLPRCTAVIAPDGTAAALDEDQRRRLAERVDGYATNGFRILAFATRELPGAVPPSDRDTAERALCLLGLAAMRDPPRPEVAEAVTRCHRAGIRIIVVSGDHPLTATAIARQVGIGDGDTTVITGEQLDRMSEDQLDHLLGMGGELIFARTSPEAKLRIADALRAEDHVVAMTGDGVNDAPALRRADIGVAMGRSGTDVAREASTMVLTDDNFATIVAAVQAGRRVYHNIRKFILYIFAHAPPEVVPFLVFALGRGAIPLPLTVLQLLAFDVGTETLPALALGREPAEPGLMNRPPRSRREGVISRSMLFRAWLFLGLIAAGLAMGAYFLVLIIAGWHPGAPVGPGHPLHHAYLQATTMTFLAMVMAQVGTAFAARTEHVALRSIGAFSNRLLLWGVAFELALAAAIIYAPPLQHLLDTAALPPQLVLVTLPFPFIVWGADELRRYLIRRRDD
jgi:magnesium-transporting ATPase (P-type)